MAPSPVIDEDKIATLIELLKKPATVGAMMEGANLSKKSVYRYLDRLEERGFIVEHSGRTRPVTYQIKNRIPPKEASR